MNKAIGGVREFGWKLFVKDWEPPHIATKLQIEKWEMGRQRKLKQRYKLGVSSMSTTLFCISRLIKAFVLFSISSYGITVFHSLKTRVLFFFSSSSSSSFSLLRLFLPIKKKIVTLFSFLLKFALQYYCQSFTFF